MSQLNPVEQLKSKIFSKSSKGDALTSVLVMAREFNCISDLCGKTFEICDPEGKLLYKVRQKPLLFKQLKELMDQFIIIKKLEEEESKKANQRRR